METDHGKRKNIMETGNHSFRILPPGTGMNLLLLLTLLVVLPHATVSAYNVALGRAPVQLEYFDSSEGLDTPEMEGGRSELELGDVNGDGCVDITCIGDHGSPYIGTGQHGIMIWFGDGGGSWQVYQNGNFGYGGIALGDVDNDGFIDAGYGMHHDYSSDDFGDQLIEVALGDGTGMNWTPWDDGLAENGESWGMFCTDFADVDCDGDLDIVANSFGSGSGVRVYRNNMDGTWTQSFGFSGGNSTMDIVFGDVNGDGFPDIAAAHEYGTVYVGAGDGGFTLADGNLPSAGMLGRYGPDLGDVDNDGCDDVSFTYGGGVEVWRWAGDSVWEDYSSGLPGSGSYEATQLADMNMDGFIDVVAFGDNRVSVWAGNGAGQWRRVSHFETASKGDYTAFRIGPDIDRNGKPDMALISDEGSWLYSRNTPHCFLEASAPAGLSVTPVRPRGGETFVEGSVRFVEWVSAVPSGVPSAITLELSVSGASGPWLTIAESIPDNGSHQLIIPQGLVSEDCYLKCIVEVNGDSAEGITGRPFSIRAK